MTFNRQLRSTLYDLIADLERNAETKVHATALREELRKVKTQRLYRTLRNRESALSKSIPEDVLERDQNGKAYLEIIREVRGTTGPTGTGTGAVSGTGLEEFGALSTLAQSIQSELGSDIPESLDQFTPQMLQDIVQRTASIMSRKHDNGELDMENLKGQIHALTAKMSDDPEFQTLSKSLAGLM